MAGFFMGDDTQERVDLWMTRVLVLLSFVAHLTLALLAGIRRRRYSGVRRSLVWLAYHMIEIGTPIALGKVFLDTKYSEEQLKVLVDTATVDSDQQLKELVDTATAYREQLMFAFWAPFLVLHLGRPDNITSYALENKGLSRTQKALLVLEIGGAIYGSYKQRFMRGDWALRVAFFIMLFFGSYKYVERAVALRRASFANIRRSTELGLFTFKRDSDDALLDAHGFLGVTMGAFAEYEVNPGNYWRFFSAWKDVINVVEIEASLMYDMLYTKASVIHTWTGYIIRVLSPLATSTALMIYLFHNKEGPARGSAVSADRMVTYILLVGTLVLDVRWLLRALGSTWTYAFLVRQQGEEEDRLLPARRTFSAYSTPLDRLKKKGLRAAMQSWYWLRRLLVSQDPSRLSLRSRLLSGVGQRNLLQECTTPAGRLEKMISFCAGPTMKKKIDVKHELLEVICTYLMMGTDGIIRMHPTGEVDDYFRSNDRSCSFERNLIALHVATDIFLLCRSTLPAKESEASAKYEKQIGALSDYMMFLLARRLLNQGDEGDHYKEVSLDLEEIWRERGTSDSPTRREAELASILLKMNETRGSGNDYPRSLLYDRNDSLGLGAYWASCLLNELEPGSYGDEMQGQNIQKLEDFIPVFTDKAQKNIKRYRDRAEQSELLDYMLELILVSWVRLLIFTSVRCSRDSHAKLLSCGGELLTIVWLMCHL